MLCRKSVSIMCLFVLCLALTGLGQGTGTIRYEVWENIGGTAVANLTGNPDFPDNPSWDEEVTLFETPTNRADNFGGRLYGWLHPDTDGDYTFWLAADDGAEVWLSTTEDAADAVLIVSEDSWGGSRDWLGRGQSSAPVTLAAGGKYYIEALYKEGGGGDNLAVAWQLNADPDPNAIVDVNDIVVIDGAFLSPAPQNPNLLKTRNPSPADGAIELVDADVALLSWEPGAGSISYNIYISTDPLVDDDDFAGSTTEPNYVVTDPLIPGMTYYWRVDAMDIGLNTYTGDVWQISAKDIVAHFPSPADGAVWQATDAQPSFTAGVGAAVHHIYFSTDKALVDARDPSVATMFSLLTTINYGDLEAATTYYWAVDEFIVPDTVPSPTWSFTTMDPAIAANVDSWNAVVAAAGPAYQAVHVADGVYDIGEYTGDQTYEFIVISDPCETQASMALIGRRSFGDTTAGIKYEQWNNTGTYGATIFGVVDLDFGVATAPGEYTHLAFVSDANSTTLFVNGVEEGVVNEPISLSGLVGIGHAISAEDGSGSFDNFDGSIFGVAIYDKALSAAEIEKNATAFFNPIAITDPNLVGWWNFDDVENGIVPDESGHGNFGVVNGDLQLVNAGGNIAAEFDGATAYVDIAASAWATIDTEVSLAFWTYIDSATLPQNNFIFGAFSDPADNNARVFSAHLPWGSTIYFDTSGPGYDRTSQAITTEELADAWVHWVFTKNAATGVVSIYLNGTLWHSATEKTKPMQGADVTKFTIGTKPSLAEGWFTGMIDDIRLYDKTLTEAEIAEVVLGISDITSPEDVIQGNPNDGDWPGGEYPGLAIDNDVTTKFLHFKGETEPSGFEVEPAMGATVVQGLALTTANDSPPRDPASFEIYGSNDSIDGPFELIASGDIVDFTQADEYPRFTRNVTAITFDNTVSYTYYRVLFPTVRDAANANSMQIAEVELLGAPAVVWTDSVTIGGDVEGDAQLVEDGVYEITGSGADVWGTSDQFHYLYTDLTGDGSISCRVTDFGTGSNTWAKGGVMIRETLDADSKHAIMAMTGGSGGGISFQGRTTAAGASSTGMHSDITAAPPQWVKLTREGNTFTAYYSADGVTWDLFTDETPDAGHSNPMDIEMGESVKIGLFVTSHAAGELRTYTIDNVSIE